MYMYIYKVPYIYSILYFMLSNVHKVGSFLIVRWAVVSSSLKEVQGMLGRNIEDFLKKRKLKNYDLLK